MMTFLNTLLASIFRRNTEIKSVNSLEQATRGNQDQRPWDNDEVPRCPYCGQVQDTWPLRSKKKCLACKKTMYVRYKSIEKERGTGNLILDDKTLATEEDAWVYDWMLDLYELGFTKKKFDKRKADYEKKHGASLRNRDAVWSILNELQDRYMRFSDLSKVQTAQFLMAKFLEEEKKDPFVLLREQGRTRLIQLKQDNCSQVIICISKRKSDPSPCDVCLALENKIYSIESALDELPIPPHECKNKYCLTYYGQIFESSCLTSDTPKMT